jgi:putative CocE/NonD family hydrolase
MTAATDRPPTPSARAPRPAAAATGAAAGMRVLRDQMVAMRDGVSLATDVYLPAKGGKFPVLLERTPYDKSQPSRSERARGAERPLARAELAAEFVRHGYAVAFQDCRGRHGSEGAFEKYVAEGHDGYDTMAWLLGREWCNGRIGTMGLSYAAHTQMAAACLSPPGLAAMVVDSGGFANAFHGGIRQGGAFELKQATWAFRQARLSPAAADPAVGAALEAEDIRAWFRRMPWRAGHSPLAAVPDYERFLLDQWTHGNFDGYWKRIGLWAAGFHDKMADVPAVLVSSWYDAYVRTATDNFVGMTRNRRGPFRLLMGPWTHGDRQDSHAGDVSFGARAPFDGNVAPSWVEYRRRWFDRWLKGEKNGVDDEKRVRLFLMGGGSGRRDEEGRLDHGGRWIEADAWPLPGTRYVPYHFHRDGRLAPERPGRMDAPIAFDFDPANPVPTIGGALTSGEPIFEGGAFDQREQERFFGCREPGLPLASRPDVLVFETPPLARDMVVIGPIVARLFVSSDAPDTDFTVKLIDVHPPSADWPRGFAMNLTDGIMRCRYRDSWEKPAPLDAGRVAEIEVSCFATCNVFKRGHRIRVDVSSSNFPRFDVNPNSFEPEGAWRTMRIARNRVHVDSGHPSHVLLPLAPLG